MVFALFQNHVWFPSQPTEKEHAQKQTAHEAAAQIAQVYTTYEIHAITFQHSKYMQFTA